MLRLSFLHLLARTTFPQPDHTQRKGRAKNTPAYQVRTMHTAVTLTPECRFWDPDSYPPLNLCLVVVSMHQNAFEPLYLELVSPHIHYADTCSALLHGPSIEPYPPVPFLPQSCPTNPQASGVVGVRDVRQFLQRCGLFTRPASPSSSPTSTPPSSNRGHMRGASQGSATSVSSGKSGKSADKTGLPPRLEPIVQCVRPCHHYIGCCHMLSSRYPTKRCKHSMLHCVRPHPTICVCFLGHRRAASSRGRACPSPCSASCSWCWPRNSTGTHSSAMLYRDRL